MAYILWSVCRDASDSRHLTASFDSFAGIRRVANTPTCGEWWSFESIATHERNECGQTTRHLELISSRPRKAVRPKEAKSLYRRQRCDSAVKRDCPVAGRSARKALEVLAMRIVVAPGIPQDRLDERLPAQPRPAIVGE